MRENLHTEYRISELYNRSVQLINTIAITSGYAGRDLQGGTSDGSFLQVLFSSQKIVKVLLVLEKKMKRSNS